MIKEHFRMNIDFTAVSAADATVLALPIRKGAEPAGAELLSLI